VSEEFVLDPTATALLVMDFQTGILDRYTHEKEALLARTAGLLAAARARHVLIIYIVVGRHVVVGFLAGFPEVSVLNKLLSALKGPGRFATERAAEIHPLVAPEPEEIIITKHRTGAFMGTDLDMTLRTNGIETLFLTGVATSGVVLSTIRHAADAGYSLIVASDCCSDPDIDVHALLMEKVFPQQAAVTMAQHVMAALGANACLPEKEA
jgi:nicotinamidase-related amidase